MSVSTTDEARNWVREGVAAFAPSMGRKAAFHHLALTARSTSRRLEAISYGEVKRLWADEYLALKAAYRSWCRMKVQRTERELAQMRLDLEKLEVT